MDGGAAAGSPHGDARGKKTIMGVQGAKPPEENSRRAFRSCTLSPQEHKFATKLYARAFWRTCSYAPVSRDIFWGIALVCPSFLCLYQNLNQRTLALISGLLFEVLYGLGTFLL